MEFSKNVDTEPMSRRQRARFEAVREVLSGLTKQVVHEPIPAMSDHYRPPIEDLGNEQFIVDL